MSQGSLFDTAEIRQPLGRPAEYGHEGTEAVYRYTLWRWLDTDAERGLCLFIMLNPSTATEYENDPTIKRCMDYAQAWGYRELAIGNLFALRATNPKELYRWSKQGSSPTGPLNDAHLYAMLCEAELVVCAWGNHGTLERRDESVLDLIAFVGHTAHCLKKVGKSLQNPAHPLYLPKNLKPEPLCRGYTPRSI